MEKLIDYSVTDVTVYPDRALVSCSGNVQLTADDQTLVFDELPLSMEHESVRVSGAGTVAVSILSVDVVQEHYEQSPSEAIQNLESEIEVVNGDIQAVEDDIATWDAEAKILTGLREATGEYAKGLSRGRMSVEEQNELLVYIRNQDRAIRKEKRALEKQERALRRRLEKLERDLSDQRSSRPRSRNQVRISVDVDGEGQFDADLSYIVRNAHWRPIYDLHYLDNKERSKELDISTFAQITQRTGQDWHDVRLKVSTARPALNQRLPELTPWYIDSYVPPPVPEPLERSKKQVMSRQAFAADAPSAGAGMVEEAMVDATMANAVLQSVSAVVTYQVAGTCTVESDGAPHKYLLGEFSPEVALTYLAVPKHTDAVFRQIKATNNGQAPLLSGQAALFFNDEYIGRTQLVYTPVEGEVELLLGVEERIEVERELTKRSVDKKFLKDHRVVYYGYEIKLQNLLDETADLELQDQLPVSRHEEIQVKLDEAKPAPSEHSDLNILEWNLKLEPQSETVITYSYTVQSPRSMRVVGLLD